MESEGDTNSDGEADAKQFGKLGSPIGKRYLVNDRSADPVSCF
jgi:hypothetical protein